MGHGGSCMDQAMGSFWPFAKDRTRIGHGSDRSDRISLTLAPLLLMLLVGSERIYSAQAHLLMNTNGTPVVLVAEDDANDVFFLRRAFQKAEIGCKIVDLPNGQMVVDYLSGNSPFDNRSQYPLPQLLLLDLKMPLMSGFEVLEWLRSHPEVGEFPVLVLSSSAHQEDVAKAQALGARDYHVKPSDQQQLVQLVRELQAKWLGQKVMA